VLMSLLYRNPIVDIKGGWFIMLELIAIILIVLWLLGLVSSYTIGGFIHVLLVIAVVFILILVIRGRRIL
jgi:hypothetical protein